MSAKIPLQEVITLTAQLEPAVREMGFNPIELPTIVMFGEQGSGKTTILECITGIVGLFPRDQNTCTRCPIEIDLVHTQRQGAGNMTAEFFHRPGEKYVSPEEVRQEIIRERDRMCQSKTSVSATPIFLKVYSPDVPDMRLVDIPGLPGEERSSQSGSIMSDSDIATIEQINGQYMRKKKTLNVVALDSQQSDITNSAIVRMMQSADPEGQNTIAVLTKLDRLGQPTAEVTEIVGKNTLKLSSGVFGVAVANEQFKSLNSLNDIERNFFDGHPRYNDIKFRMGMSYVMQAISGRMVSHIRDALPGMRLAIESLIKDKRRELDKIGPEKSNAVKGRALTKALIAFAEDFRKVIEGTSDLADYTSEVLGGARIEYIYRDIYGRVLEEVDIMDGLDTADINTLITNSQGFGGGMFIPDEAFKVIVKQNVRRLEDPAQQCVLLVFEEVMSIINDCNPPEIDQYDNLRAGINEACQSYLNQLLPLLQKNVHEYVGMELTRVNLNHPYFIGRTDNLAQVKNEVAADLQRRDQLKDDPHQSRQAKIGGKKANLSGVLFLRRGEKITVWKQLFVIMDHESFTIRMYKSKSDPSPEGAIKLQGCTIELVEYNKIGKKNAFSVTESNGDTTFFHTLSFKEAQQWVARLMYGATGKEAPEKPDVAPDGTLIGEKIVLDSDVGTISAKTTFTAKERLESAILVKLLSSYFDIIKKNMQDYVPKAISKILIHGIQDGLVEELISRMYTDEYVETLMGEPQSVANTRKRLKHSIPLLESAIAAIKRI